MNKQLKAFSLFAVACCMSLAGCGGGGPQSSDFDFTLSLKSGKTQLQIGETDEVVIATNGVVLEQPENYVYKVTDDSVLEINENGGITAKGVGKVTITVTETNTEVSSELYGIEVIDAFDPANGGFNYAASSGAQAIATRTEILGSLEKYAMDSHLTGITLFENGGYVKYHKRLDIPAKEYIAGYGFGILSEGHITAELPAEQNPNYKMYLHSASASDPRTINAYNNDGSEVSDLHGYISCSYWGTRMDSTKTKYEWYPILAKTERPIPVGEINPLGLYKRWRIYVKTGADGIRYRTLSTTRSEFNNRPVKLEDYEFIYQALLTGANSMSRGQQMASDQSYGIKGALQYYNRTKNMKNQSEIDAVWNDMKAKGTLGIAIGSNDNGSYIELELVNPVDDFTAMYSLSSNLTSPLPRSFIETVGNGSIIDGMKWYGSFKNTSAINNSLNLGPFMLEAWDDRQQIVFKRNDDWFEHAGDARYHIPGVKIRVVTNATQNPDAIYDLFNAGELDSCGIPVRHIDEERGQEGVRETKGDSTFKLNVNSCDQATWNELFGEKGKIHPKSKWEVKPWMSNNDFLNGLFYSINRKEFAAKRGVKPSINYFSDAYMSDPINGVSYNSTSAHEKAVKSYQVYTGTGEDREDQYGYDLSKAVRCFKSAVNTLVKEGKMVYGKDIHITIEWMYESDKTEYGNDIAKYFQDAFNNKEVCGEKIKLIVDQKANTDWQLVYDHMRAGEFDLAFGAISGNTLNPLNFLEVLKSDNSSGFTLNWGTDTSVVDKKHPLIYNEKSWSFDALWSAADHGSVVEAGRAAKSVKKAYIDKTTKLDGSTVTADLTSGAITKINMEFVNVPDVAFAVDSVQLYVIGYGAFEVPCTITKVAEGQYTISLEISASAAAEIENQIRVTNKKEEEPETTHFFTISNYNTYWTFESYYNLSIKGGTPSQNYSNIAKNAAEPLE